jgi:hypothetical protein
MTHVANMFTHRVVYLTTDAMPSTRSPLTKASSVSAAARDWRSSAIAWTAIAFGKHPRRETELP